MSASRKRSSRAVIHSLTPSTSPEGEGGELEACGVVGGSRDFVRSGLEVVGRVKDEGSRGEVLEVTLFERKELMVGEEETQKA